LSTQYAVRGNYDENLVYVNEMKYIDLFWFDLGNKKVYFTNTDLVQNVDFSAGGFQAKFGDKLSSVLRYHVWKPSEFGATFEASFLGGSFSIDAISKTRNGPQLREFGTGTTVF
jgi:hypothetical protein